MFTRRISAEIDVSQHQSPRSAPSGQPIERPHLADTGSLAFVSAASVWEITTKYRLGKLPQAALIASNVPSAVSADGFMTLSIELAHAQLAGSLQGAHKDPFDRMLAAQALLEGLVLVSNDEVFDTFGVKRLW
ncbi:MAG: type II toxin-antitoxin system VapC family toxin, partial [Alphaproteobacteria bacterium]|nr:type II toxin-antitoxin system VapC family toxin [Alphaproteobacteria bacterium]